MGKRLAGREATDRERIDAIVDILKKAVFTDDETAAFAALDALANGIDSISFNASSHKFTDIDDTFTLLIVTDPEGKAAQVTWATSNASVATVNNGVVTAVADGNATITATTTDGKVAICNIEVQTIVVNSITLNKATTTLNGNGATETLAATIDPANYPGTVNWSSSDTSKVTVANGVLTAVANTVANSPVVITAEAGGQTATCQVTVTGVMQTFHVNVGNLSNVTIEDGQGNAITNGQAILEGSAITINFVPAASHEISALSVVMGNTTLALADATDGTDGAKVISIQSVSGDIAVSASASYVRTNLINGLDVLEKYGVRYNTYGNFGSDTSYDCYIVPLEFGKRYEVNGYDWYAKNGTSGGYNIALVKSDGNGGFTNLLGTDITDTDAFDRNNTIFKKATNVYKDFKNDAIEGKPEHFFVTVPVASAFDSSVDKVYLAINTRYASLDISSDISMYEFLFGEQYDADNIIGNYGLTYPNYSLLRDNSYDVSIVKAVKGATYSYIGMKWSELNANGAGFCIALLKGAGGTEMVDNLKNTDFKSGASWLSSDSYFSKSANICKGQPAETGSFTIPASSDLAADTDIYIAITTRYSTYDVSSYLTLTKQ